MQLRISPRVIRRKADRADLVPHTSHAVPRIDQITLGRRGVAPTDSGVADGGTGQVLETGDGSVGDNYAF